MNFRDAQALGVALAAAMKDYKATAEAAGVPPEAWNPVCAAATALNDASALHYGQTVVPDAGVPKHPG